MNRAPLILPLVMLLLLALAGPSAAGPVPAAVPVDAPEPRLVQAQFRTECFYVHGIEQDSGRLYRIRLAQGIGIRRTAELIGTPPSHLEIVEPNALAFDRRTERLYFAGAGAGGRSVLHFYDVNAGAFRVAGELRGRAHGAAFEDGDYLYVDQGTDELRRVFLAEDGSVFAEATVADFELDRGMVVDDLAVLDGVIYGSTSGGEDSTARFFAYDIDRDAFRTLSTGSATYLQLAFANDRGLMTLYGVSTPDGVFYEIDHADWASGSTFVLPADARIPFTDLARGPFCN